MELGKKLFRLIVPFLFFMPCFGQEKAMTLNIRYNTSNDGENSWENRGEDLVRLLAYYEPDFLGTQEGLQGQLQYIDNELSPYDHVGVGRDDGKEKGEFTAIFYNTNKYELLKTETFWLSDTPNKVSVGWDASMERICTYGVFKNKAKQNIVYIFNAHFDHLGEEAQKRSAELILQKIKDLDILNSPLLVMGDFNCLPKDEPISIFKSFLDDALSISQKELYGPKGTFNGFDSELIPQDRIDYIFTKNITNIKSYRHINDKRKNGLCISDHLPVLLEFQIN